jgi:uncharacterized peroxidase-related enzyme
MPRLQSVDPAAATGQAKQLLETLKQKFGMVPNITRLMANSPAALEGYLNFSGALAKGKLNPQLRERIAIAVANANGCNYCLSAHTAMGQMAGLSAAELAAAQHADSSDEKVATALRFVAKLVRERGWVGDDDVAGLRQAGFADGEITEIVATVALNIFTNYFNHVAETEIDFPLVKATAS